jgi:hypothetical protein
MNDENERSVASAGSVAERPLGDPEIAVEILKLRVAELEQAIRRLAEQDATLSVVGGNVIVEMDTTLTDAEREAVAWAARLAQSQRDSRDMAGDYAASMRGLLERTKTSKDDDKCEKN